jgi:hypothetical protein
MEQAYPRYQKDAKKNNTTQTLRVPPDQSSWKTSERLPTHQTLELAVQPDWRQWFEPKELRKAIRKHLNKPDWDFGQPLAKTKPKEQEASKKDVIKAALAAEKRKQQDASVAFEVAKARASLVKSEGGSDGLNAMKREGLSSEAVEAINGERFPSDLTKPVVPRTQSNLFDAMVAAEQQSSQYQMQPGEGQPRRTITHVPQYYPHKDRCRVVEATHGVPCQFPCLQGSTLCQRHQCNYPDCLQQVVNKDTRRCGEHRYSAVVPIPVLSDQSADEKDDQQEDAATPSSSASPASAVVPSAGSIFGGAASSSPRASTAQRHSTFHDGVQTCKVGLQVDGKAYSVYTMTARCNPPLLCMKRDEPGAFQLELNGAEAQEAISTCEVHTRDYRDDDSETVSWDEMPAPSLGLLFGPLRISALTRRVPRPSRRDCVCASSVCAGSEGAALPILSRLRGVLVRQGCR